MRKKIVGIIVGMCFFALIAPMVERFGFGTEEVYAETSEDGLWGYSVLDDETVEINKYLGNATEVVIPAEINGMKVTGIGSDEWVFNWFAGLKSIELPNSITKIGDNAFSGCMHLSSIELPGGVKEIGERAFYGCSSLNVVELPDSVEKIGGSAFDGCQSLSNIKIPNKIKEIKQSTFSGCSSLSSVEMSSSVTNIGIDAFFGCGSLRSIEIPNGITKISDGTFASCSSLSVVKLPNTVTEIGDYAFEFCGITSIEIPDSVTKIGIYAFESCDNLMSVEIPNSVTEIGDSAFRFCDNLSSVEIPSSVVKIGELAFAQCKSLSSIGVSARNTYYTSENGMLFDKEKNELICCPGGKEGSVEILSTVTKIGSYAFSSCGKINAIRIPDSVIEIDDYAFYECSGLSSMELPSSVAEIGEGLFYECSALSSIELPNSMTKIGKSTFFKCNSLSSVVLPSSIEKIEDSAFSGCSSLNSIELPSSIREIGYYAFSRSGLSSIEIPNSVQTIVDYAFFGCSSLVDIKLPNSITKIGYSVFQECSSLRSIKIPDSITEICYGAFYNCASLSKVEIPNSVKGIGAYAFDNCPNLIIHCEVNSTAYQYANTNGIKFKLIGVEYITDVVMNSSIYIYDGYAKKPTVTVKAGTKKLSNETDYAVTYKNNINPGIATVIVTGKGNYIGTITKTFKINLSKVGNFKQSNTYATTKITMSWKKVKGADGYAIYCASTKNGTYKYLKSSKTNTSSHAGLKSGSKYYYKVRAYKTVNGKKIYGADSDAKSMLTKPAAPTGFLVTLKDRTAKISWSKSTGAQGYEVYMSNSRNDSYTRIKNAGSSATSYNKTGLVKGKKYYFKMRAYTKTGTGVKVYSGYSKIKAVTVK